MTVQSPITFRAPWNFQLPQRPSPPTSFRDVAGELERLYNCLLQMQLAFNIVSGNLEAIFSENVAFGALVNLYSNAGVLNARNANSGTGGSSGAVQPAHGFCNTPGGVLTGKTGFVQRGTGLIQGLTGLTLGANYWLKAADGQMQTTPDTTATHIEQYLGVALSATQLSYVAHPWIQH